MSVSKPPCMSMSLSLPVSVSVCVSVSVSVSVSMPVCLCITGDVFKGDVVNLIDDDDMDGLTGPLAESYLMGVANSRVTLTLSDTQGKHICMHLR